MTIFDRIDLSSTVCLTTFGSYVSVDYIEGTTKGEPDCISNAFHQDLNLYAVANDTLIARSGQRYIANFKPGEKYNRMGSIVSIDYENDAAMVKVRVLMPDMKRMYTNYLLLLKAEWQWKIIHKSYTYEEYPE